MNMAAARIAVDEGVFLKHFVSNFRLSILVLKIFTTGKFTVFESGTVLIAFSFAFCEGLYFRKFFTVNFVLLVSTR